MRQVASVVLLCQLLLGGAALGADREYRQVVVNDPYIELHTGPGRGYPVFFIAERGEEISLLKQRTEWFKVRIERGEEGWVNREQLRTTLNLDGVPFDLSEDGFDDYASRRWEVGAMYGDFGGANVISTYVGKRFTPNLSGELSVSQALGRFADSTLATLNIVHLMYPEWRASPFFTLGGGVINTRPKATLVSAVDRTDNFAQAGAGVRLLLRRRFVFRAEYKAHVVFTSRDDNEEVREWKAGLSFFF